MFQDDINDDKQNEVETLSHLTNATGYFLMNF